MSLAEDCSKCGMSNPVDGGFCSRCGAILGADRARAWHAPSMRWVAFGVAVVVLAACGAWWLNTPRPVATPGFDAAPPPSMSAASNPATAPSWSPDETARPAPPTAATAATAAPAAARPPSGDLWEPVDRPAARVTSGPAEARQAVGRSAEREARARASREQGTPAATRAEADADANAARQRLEQARGRGVPAAATARRNPAPAPAPARSVAERCVDLNIISRAICESRECVRAEHAREPVCQRIRAADDRRREQ